MSNEPLKIAMLLNNFNGGGGERAHIMLANGLADIGNDVELIVINSGGPLESLVSKNVRVTHLRCNRAVSALPALVKAIRSLSPDILVSAMVISNVLAGLVGIFVRNLPIVAIEHGDMNATYQSDKIKLAALVGYRLAPFVYERFARIYCVDQSSLISVAAFTRKGSLPLQIMPNAVIDETVDLRMQIDPEHPFFSDGLPVLLNIGRFSEQKDQSLLLRAFAQLYSAQPARLIILGDGPLRAELEGERDRLGLKDVVDMPGFVDPFPFLARAKTFVLSSSWEALPTVVIEALYCGCNVVVTKASMGTLELVGYGRYGRIAQERTEAALVAEIKASLSDVIDVPALKKRGSFYHKISVAALYEKDFQEILKENRRALDDQRSR